MRLVDMFRRRPEVTADDPVFGSLRRSEGYWSGKAVFPVGGDSVQVLVRADEAGPTDSQRTFWAEAILRYDHLRPDVEAMLIQLANEILEGGDFHPEISIEQFVLDSVTIGAVVDGTAEWELSFGWDLDPDWVLEVSLQNWRIVSTSLGH